MTQPAPNLPVKLGKADQALANAALDVVRRASNLLASQEFDAGQYDIFNRLTNAALAKLTLGVSPVGLLLAFADWSLHLSLAPGKQAELLLKAVRKMTRFWLYVLRHAAHGGCATCIEPLAQDKRFSDDAWRQPPFAWMYQGFLLTQQWWHNATTGITGVSHQNESIVSFAARQWLDVFAPSNYLLTNPVLQQKTYMESGQNLLRGAMNFLEDWERAVANRKPVGSEDFRVGVNIACTPGRVVHSNHLVEVIEYASQTDTVQREPILIVPAWIMKYYVLDLSPHNSLVNYLVQQGHRVFMLSWKNPDANDRELNLNDYLSLGIMAGLETVRKRCGESPIHAVGYCLGGTLLAIATAALARDRQDWLRSVTLLAAQVDFTEPGELSLFISESELAFLDDIMWQQGYLDTSQMAGTFQLLRSNDLIWSRRLKQYLMGDREPMTDLSAWNADTTRMPYRMHSEYLRRMFFQNDLANARYCVGDEVVALSDIRLPMFVVGTEADHIAPWRSVYKIHQLVDTDVTFVLTNGGHNAGIVSEPGHQGRYYRIHHKAADDPHLSPDQWVNRATLKNGSWWLAWHDWLTKLSSGVVTAQPLDSKLPSAPGNYVLQG